MKIALVRYRYTPYGGAERYMARLIDGLIEEGHDIHVFAAEWDTGTDTKITVHTIPVIKLTGWLKALTFSINCRKQIEEVKPDIVFSLERILHQDIYRAGDGCHRQWLIQKNLGKNLFFKAWTWLNPFQLAYIWLERKMLTNPSLKAIITNSKRGKQDIIDLYGIESAKIHVVYNGLEPVTKDTKHRQQCRIALAMEFQLGEELRLLYVGSGFKRKGVATAISATAILKVPFRLFIVGSGRTAKYRRLANSLGIADRVIFTGPRKDVEMFYQGCDVFIFPTLYDPFSNATLEAMANGLPVITSKFNGVSELIQQGSNGFVVENPLDALEISSHINLLADSDSRLQIGNQAAVTASTLTIKRNVTETLAVIDSVSYR